MKKQEYKSGDKIRLDKNAAIALLGEKGYWREVIFNEIEEFIPDIRRRYEKHLISGLYETSKDADIEK